MKLSTIAATHARLEERLRGEQSWDYLADGATVLLLLLSGLQDAIDIAPIGDVTPHLMVASAAIQAAGRDLQLVREWGSESTLIDSHVRTKMAWHNLGHAIVALRQSQSTATDVA